MKKALILSLGLAIIFGLAGCTTEEKSKIEQTPMENITVEVEKIEKPVMVLGEELPGKNAIDAAKNVADLANESMDPAQELIEGTVE